MGRWARLVGVGVTAVLLGACSGGSGVGAGLGSSQFPTGSDASSAVSSPEAGDHPGVGAGPGGSQSPPGSEASSAVSSPRSIDDKGVAEDPLPSATADPRFVLATIDTDQRCTANQSDGSLVPLGIGLEDIAAMSPERELQRAVARTGQDWWTETGFQNNVDVAEWGYPVDDLTTWQDGCDALVKFGRVTGFTAQAQPSCTGEGCTSDDEHLPQAVRASVHLLQTEAGAQAFLKLLATSPWESVRGECDWCPFDALVTGSPPPDVEHLQRRGATLTRVADRNAVGEVEMVLVRRGRVVGQVLVTGPPGRMPDVDAESLAVAVATRISSVPTRANPYDVTQVMSAPLRIDELGCPDSGCPGGVGWVDGSDNADFLNGMAGRQDRATRHIKRYGRTVSFSAGNTVPEFGVATKFTQYRDPRAALAAVADLSSAPMLGGYGMQAGGDDSLRLVGRFPVPGVPGASGLTLHVSHQLDWSSPSWIVLFPHGSGVAQVSVGSHEEVVGATPVEGEHLAAELALKYAQRLDEVLG